MKKYIILIILLGFVSLAIASNLPAPPPLTEEPPAEQMYLQSIYRYWNVLEVVTSNPDGTKIGKKGEIILLQTGGNSYLEVNTDGNTVWRGIILTDTP